MSGGRDDTGLMFLQGGQSVRQELHPSCQRVRGASLVLVLALLGCVIVSGLTLIALLRVERRAAANHVDAVRARLIAEAGLARATTELSLSAHLDPCAERASRWVYAGRGTPLGVTRAVSFQEGEDTLGPRSGIVGGTYAPGGDRYLVKVLDTSSLLDLNGPPLVVSGCLDALGRALALRGGVDPVRGRGALVASAIARRGGLHSKGELGTILGADDSAAIEDYVTAAAVVDPRTLRVAGFESRGYPIVEAQVRAAICVNTAPWPVLVAIFTSVTGRDTVEVDVAAAGRIASRLLAWRESREVGRGPFTTWDALAAFFEAEGSAAGLTPGQVEALIANASPHFVSTALNPDASALRCRSAEVLTRRTCELSLTMSGVFEVESLGRVCLPDGSSAAEARLAAAVRVFDVARHASQLDFRGGSSSNTIDGPFVGAPSSRAGCVQLAPRPLEEPREGFLLDGSAGVTDAYLLPAVDPTATGIDQAHLPKGHAWGFWKKRLVAAASAPAPPPLPWGMSSTSSVFGSRDGLHLDGLRVTPGLERPWRWPLAELPPSDRGRLALWIKLGEDPAETLVLDSIQRLGRSFGARSTLRVGWEGAALRVVYERRLVREGGGSAAPPPYRYARSRVSVEQPGAARPHEWHRVVVDWEEGVASRLWIDGRKHEPELLLPAALSEGSIEAVSRIDDAIALGGSLDGTTRGGDLTIGGLVLDIAELPTTPVGGDRYGADAAAAVVGTFAGRFGPFESDVRLGTLSWTVFRPTHWGSVTFRPDEFATSVQFTAQGVTVRPSAQDGRPTAVERPGELSPMTGSWEYEDAYGHVHVNAHEGVVEYEFEPKDGSTTQHGKVKASAILSEVIPGLPQTLVDAFKAKSSESLRPDVVWKGGVIDYEFQFVYDRDALRARGIDPPPLDVTPVIEDVTLTYVSGPRVLCFEWRED